MKLLQIAVLIAGLSCFVGCGGGAATTRVTPHALSDVVSIRQSTFCEALPPENCVGEFGFTVDAQGNFTAGPSPSGNTITGTFTTEELAALQSALAPVVQSSVLECHVIQPPFTSDDHVVVTFSDGSSAPIAEQTFSNQQTQQCFRNGESGSQAFRDELDSLLVKYYPHPFPQ
jgi:hypothetical protein